MAALKRIVHAIFMSLGMFCAIPCPYRPWDDGARNLMVAFLPLVGALVGLVWWSVSAFLALFGVPAPLAAALLCAAPHLATGFLHLDGFMDTSDAILSRRPAEEKLRILKDPHTGAFAVISLAMLLLISFGACLTLAERRTGLPAFFFLPVIVRACAGTAVSFMRPLGHSQYAGAYRERTQAVHALIPCLLGLTALAASALLYGAPSLLPLAAAAGAYALAARGASRALGGFSGDLSGYALVIAEAGGLVALALL